MRANGSTQADAGAMIRCVCNERVHPRQIGMRTEGCEQEWLCDERMHACIHAGANGDGCAHDEWVRLQRMHSGTKNGYMPQWLHAQMAARQTNAHANGRTFISRCVQKGVHANACVS